MQNEITHLELMAKIDANSQLLQRIHQELMHHKHLLEGAFPFDERGQPDYGRHKQHHMAIIESDKAMGEYKRAVTMRLLQGGIGILLAVFGLGVGPYITKLIGDLI